MTARLLLVPLVSGLALAACQDGAPPADESPAVGTAVAVEGGSYSDVTVAELQAMLADKDFPLINVHVPFEGDLPDTDDSIPFDQVADHLDRLPADRDAKIVLYCRSGSMSSEAATTLARLGFTNVFHLAGGFRAWRAAGLPMEGG